MRWRLPTSRRPVARSSAENDRLEASRAVDGLLNTRWSSAFTDDEWIEVDLGAEKLVKAVRIEPRYGDQGVRKIILSVSKDGVLWDQVWQAAGVQEQWLVPLTRVEMGAETPGRKVRFIRLETRGKWHRVLQLHRLEIYGENRSSER